MPILAKDWYEPKPDLTSFYQGDVILDVPVIFLPDRISKWFILRPGNNSKLLVDEVMHGNIPKWFQIMVEGTIAPADKWQPPERLEFVAATAKMMNVIILTQSCDLGNRSCYQIAPIYPETNLKDSGLANMRTNDLLYTFYLPAFTPNIPENSFADLSHTTLVPKGYFPKDSVREKLAARLTTLAITKLQEQIANYFGRPFGFSKKDVARMSADHACIHCFYTRGEARVRKFEKDAHFEACTKCGEDRWLRVVRSADERGTETEPIIEGLPDQESLQFDADKK